MVAVTYRVDIFTDKKFRFETVARKTFQIALKGQLLHRAVLHVVFDGGTLNRIQKVRLNGHPLYDEIIGDSQLDREFDVTQYIREGPNEFYAEFTAISWLTGVTITAWLEVTVENPYGSPVPPVPETVSVGIPVLKTAAAAVIPLALWFILSSPSRRKKAVEAARTAAELGVRAAAPLPVKALAGARAVKEKVLSRRGGE